MKEKEQGSNSNLFYLMLIIGIVGVVGFLLVAGGALGK